MTDSDTKKTRGVSPVIGVILMVAVVVILAALIGVYAIALSDSTESNVNAGVETDTTEEGVLVRWNSKGNADEITVLVNGEPVNNARLSGVGDSVTVSTGADDTVTIVGVGPDGNQTQLQTTTPSSDTTGGSGDPQVVSGGGGPPGEEVTGLVRINPPIEGANVISYDTSGNQIDTATTDSDGNYTINAVENGEVVVNINGSHTYNNGSDGDADLYAAASKTVSDTSSDVEFDFDETKTTFVSGSDISGSDFYVVYQTNSTSTNQIGNAHQLAGIAEHGSSENYELVKDVDASTADSWTNPDGTGFNPIESFSGTFDGKGHTISNVTIEQGSGYHENVGMFKKVNNGTVKDMTVADPVIKGTEKTGTIGVIDGTATIDNITVLNADITGDDYVGGLIGTSENTDSIVKNSEVSGSVSGADGVGGLVGLANADITTSHSSASVSDNGESFSGDDLGGLVGNLQFADTISNSYATGNVSGRSDVGGLVGTTYTSSSQTIENSYATGDVSATERAAGGLVGKLSGSSTIAQNSYATGDVTSDNQAGGLVGQLYSGQVKSSYSTGNVTDDDDDVGGLVGYASGGVIENSFSSGYVEGIEGESSYTAGYLVGNYSENSDTGNNPTITNSYGNDSPNSNIDSNSYGSSVSGVDGMTGPDYNSGFESDILGLSQFESADGEIPVLAGLDKETQLENRK